MSRVRDFHLRFGHPAPDFPPLRPDPDLVRFRMRLVREEYEELHAELAKLPYAATTDDVLVLLRKIVKEAVDLCYVAEGTAVAFGLPFEAAYEATHRSNMSKTPAPDGVLGKPSKGPNYVEADMELLLPDFIEHEEDRDHG